MNANQMYTMDDEAPFSLDEFVSNNEYLDPEEIQAIADLKVGETYMLGGGAAAEMIVRRIS